MASPPWARVAGRVLGIDTTKPRQFENVAGAEQQYLETEPSTKDYLWAHRPTRSGLVRYIRTLFPFWDWIFHYNLTWMFGDVIAGATVGFVVVPQGMSYALLANLPPEYGLYTSFMGVLVYWLFATSKDITIGTVAVASTIVGNAILRVQQQHPGDYSNEQIAKGLALLCGAVLAFVGLIRAGFVVEFISLVAIASFMTGAALSIGVGQIPGLLGISGVNTRDPTHLVIIHTLQGLPKARIDAALGLTALSALYFIRWVCGFLAERQPKRRKLWFFVSTMRQAVIVIIYILVSWLVNSGISRPSQAEFKILGKVPGGLRRTGVPLMNQVLLSAVAPDIPSVCLVLIIEHVAISKSFGRVNNYIIDPSQELVAIGVSNIFGPFLGGYAQTGSFSRTAIQAKAGVRTPLAGLFTGVIVLLALYALTSVFFYIPLSVLSAIIIHAVGDLITPPRQVYKFWITSPLEVIIFLAGLFASLFSSLENGIFVTVTVSAALLLFRLSKSPGKFLGRVDTVVATRDSLPQNASRGAKAHDECREVFVPYDRSDLFNPRVHIRSPYPGIFVYRFGENFNYLNCARHLDMLTLGVFGQTRKTDLDKFTKLGDRPWNDPGPRRGHPAQASDEMASRPFLRAVVLDFSAVNFIDVTSAQALVDLRNQFNRYAAPDEVEWHFAGVSNAWTKRALVASGFGVDSEQTLELVRRGKSGPIVTLAEVEPPVGGPLNVETKVEPRSDTEKEGRRLSVDQMELARDLVALYGINRPFFHVDIAKAVQSAAQNVRSYGPYREGSSSSTAHTPSIELPDASGC